MNFASSAAAAGDGLARYGYGDVVGAEVQLAAAERAYEGDFLQEDMYEESAHLALVATMERAGRHGEARRRYLSYASQMEEIGAPAAPFPAGP